MLFENLISYASYALFWNRKARHSFRYKSLAIVIDVKQFVFNRAFHFLPESNKLILFEERIWVFGIPVMVRRRPKTRYRIGLLVDEFFGGWNTAIGGYGALARKYICQYIPNAEIQVDLLLDIGHSWKVQSAYVDKTIIYRLPNHPKYRQKWLAKQCYNLFLSIEMTEMSYRILGDFESEIPLLYWIQDPRDLDLYQSRLQAVNRIRDGDWEYLREVAIWMQKLIGNKMVRFISQGESLSRIARSMYNIPDSELITDLPNPVDIDFEYILETPPKGNRIIYLGRLEAQKRVWIVCEIAKIMPQYEFYILGATGKGRDEVGNTRSLQLYRNVDGTSKVKNLHFLGHVDGELKSRHIREAKLLLNTSVWEGIPVSWLEALSFGTLIVSAFDRDNIVGRFGTFVGEIPGDGVDSADLIKLVTAIECWMSDDARRTAVARQAMDFVRSRHSIPAFVTNMRAAITETICSGGPAFKPAYINCNNIAEDN